MVNLRPVILLYYYMKNVSAREQVTKQHFGLRFVRQKHPKVSKPLYTTNCL
jgi:hypothetical protein